MNKLKASLLFTTVMVMSAVAQAQDSEITIAQVNGQQGDELSVAVTLDPNNHDLADFQIDIVFNDAELTLRGGGASCGFIDVGSDLGGDHFANCSLQDTDTLRVGVVPSPAGPPQPIPEGELLLVRIDINNDAAPATYPLAATNASAGNTDANDVTENTTFNDGSVTVTEGPQPDLVFNPADGSTINFGTQEQGTTSSPELVQVCNDGDAEIDSISAALTGGDTGEFSVDDSGCSDMTLGGDDCCTVQATFTPSMGGNTTFTADMDIDTSEGTGNFTLTGEGVDGPAGSLSISPASHDFGQLLTNDESDTQTFTVTSDGVSGSEVAIDSVGLTGDTVHFTILSENCDGTTLPESESCSVTVEFEPTADGSFSVALEVSGEDGNGDTQSATAEPIEGEGTSEARFSANPAPGTVSLGATQPGGTLSQDVTITNEGNENLDAECGSLDDPDGVFSLSQDPADFLGIEPGNSESFTVSCTLPDVASYEATLSCSTNDPDNAQVDYTFRCTGQPLIIPTMQTWGLMLFALMMLIIGGFSIRFFRVG